MSWVHLDGALVRAEDAKVSVFDRGLLLGDGLFETLRAYAGRPAFLDEHLARLREGCAALRLPIPDDLAARVAETLARNGDPDAAVRITLTRGQGGRGASPRGAGPPTVIVTASPIPYAEGSYARGLSAVVSSVVRPHAGLKTTSYVASILARLEADDAGADEAILVDAQQHLLEASQANLFLVVGRELVTPRLGAILPGVTRAKVLALAEDAGLRAVERPITRADALAADEALLTASVLEVAPLVLLDGARIGAGAPGPVARRLRALYRARADAHG